MEMMEFTQENNISEEDQLDYDKVRNKQFIANSEVMVRLSKNVDFQQIVLKGYFQDELSRLTKLLGSLKISDQAEVLADITAIGSFQNYLIWVHKFGQIAKDSIREIEEEEDIIKEEGEDQF